MDKKKALEDITNHFAEQQAEIQRTIEQINDSMFQETKSSMGDKYETSRSMLQIDKGNAFKRLDLVQRNMAAVKRLSSNKSYDCIEIGALFMANNDWFFMGIPFNKLESQGKVVQGISPVSPLGKALQGKTEGASVVFLGVEWRIQEIN